MFAEGLAIAGRRAFAALRFEWLVGPRYARWVRAGASVGAMLGLAAYCAALAYFEFGPGRANPDRGDVHGWLIIWAGFPASLVGFWGFALGAVLGHALLAASVAVMWGIYGGVVAGLTSAVYYRLRNA